MHWRLVGYIGPEGVVKLWEAKTSEGFVYMIGDNPKAQTGGYYRLSTALKLKDL